MFQIWVVGRGRRPEGLEEGLCCGKVKSLGGGRWMKPDLCMRILNTILGSAFLSPICWPFGPLAHRHAFQVCIHEWHQLLLGLLRSSWWVKVGSKTVVAPSSACLTPLLRASCLGSRCPALCLTTHPWKPQNAFIQVRDLNSGLWYSEALLPMKEDIGQREAL